MKLLDFIKNRQTQQQPAAAAQPQPETARQMYTQEAAQDRATSKSLSQMPADQQSKLAEVSKELQARTMSPEQAVAPPSAAPGDPTANAQPMKQASMQQDKAAPDMSPTTAQAGGREAEKPTPLPTPSRSQDHAKTMARTTPSWER